ncbi:helix-turn-helix domain-containing protein [Kribbella sp. NPDC051952]|uniref:helix-turn-helix domain-containing protein n=1 Tax=Kribbella sp. NPDC051952 TaxID=3154851 RepID=UPI00342E9578
MQSLSRALTVLAELNREDRPYGVTELAGVVGLHKSTVHRILVTFCEHGLADRVDDHRYTALDGLAAIRPAERRPRAELADLSDRLGRLVVLAKPLPKTAGTVLQVAAVSGGGSVQPGHAVSLRQSALGRAYLSALPADQISGTPDLLDALRRVRVSGFAHNSRPVASLPRMVAVPVRDRDGRCAGALGAELIQTGSIEEVRRVVSVLRSGS